MTKTKLLITILILFFGIFGLAKSSLAADHYVSPSGTASWASCTNINTPCSLSSANTNAVAGDTVYLRGGTYSFSGSYREGISPVNSGTDTNHLIIFAAASGETPLLKAESGCTDCWGIGLNHANRYIKIDGLNFLNFARWAMLINYASHNEISNSSFKSETGEDVVNGFFIGAWCVGGQAFNCYSTNNWVHNNVFSKAHRSSGDTASCYEGRDLMRIGDPPSVSDTTGANNNNTIENNYLEYAGHALFDTYGAYTVFRNNVLHNEAWIPDTSGGTCNYPPMPNGMYGHRDMQISEDFGRPATYMLLEGNRVGYSSANPNNPGEGNIAIAAPRNIVRYNFVYGGQQAGFFFKYVTNGRIGAGGMGSTDNRVYNNTSFHNGWTYPYMQQYLPTYNGHTCSTCPGKLAGFTSQSGTSGNILKNNIAYDNFSYYLNLPNMYPGTLYKGLDITVDSGKNPEQYPNELTLINNWTTSNGDPKFTNSDVTEPTSKTLPDLSLQSSSPAINEGTNLTTAVGSGNDSTTLAVKDALYFQDGTWGSELARGKTLFPDWISIGTVDNKVEIASINYDTNTITLATPMTWSDGANIWLFKKSDGKQVLFGSAPDMGASESESGSSGGSDTTAPAIPSGLTVK